VLYQPKLVANYLKNIVFLCKEKNQKFMRKIFAPNSAFGNLYQYQG